jgi:hypothetical protein
MRLAGRKDEGQKNWGLFQKGWRNDLDLQLFTHLTCIDIPASLSFFAKSHSLNS